MLRLTIKNKLRLLGALVAMAMIFMTWRLVVSMNDITILEEAKTQTAVAEAGMLTLRRNEKDFLARLDPKYLDKFEKNLAAKTGSIDALIVLLEESGLGTDEAEQVKTILGTYGEVFKKLGAVQREIGFTHEDGLRGSLRNAVHNAETQIRDLGDHELLSDMLMLRRNEKDFMLRLDQKYLGKFNKNYVAMMDRLNTRNLQQEQKDRLTGAMTSYHDQFLRFVEGMKRKGLSSKEGLRGEMRDVVHQTEGLLDKMSADIAAAVATRSTALTTQAVVIALVVSVLIVGFIMLLSVSIGRRIQAFGGLVQKIRDTDDLSLRFEVEGKDEIDEMGDHFNSMMEEFSGIIEEVVSAVERLSASAEELSAITEQTSAGMARQQQETDSVAAAMNEMEATVDEIARSTVDAATVAQETDASAKHGKGVVDGAANAIHRLAAELEEAGTVMAKLEEESNGVSTILDVIREIAEQTNLLALNAAIEAARAGEQGRGFAVVADEVRTLARRTQESIEKIHEMIERLQNEAHEAITVMNRGRSRGEETVAEASQAAEALQLITEGVASITDKNTHIASASEQQRSVTEEVNRNVVSIKSVTDETAQSVQHMASSSHELAEVAQRLNQTVHRFKRK